MKNIYNYLSIACLVGAGISYMTGNLQSGNFLLIMTYLTSIKADTTKL